MNSLSAAERADVSYRQLDYWIRKGYIRGALPGTGFQRDLNGREVDVLMAMADLVRAGFRPDAAAEVARQMCESRLPEVEVGRILVTRMPAKEAS